MTEAEWLACANPLRLLPIVCRTGKHTLFELGKLVGVLRQNKTERRLRLFACGCMRQAWDLLSGPHDRKAIELAEEYVEGGASIRDLIAARGQLESFAPICVTERFARAAAESSTHEAADLLASKNLDDPRRPAALLCLANVFRDIFGNPFRSVTFAPEWRTDTVVTLARQMYVSREFSAMPILADALQDVGCDNGNILDHCRGPGPHVLGCWVVDLVLGKE